MSLYRYKKELLNAFFLDSLGLNVKYNFWFQLEWNTILIKLPISLLPI